MTVPAYVIQTIFQLQSSGFEAFVVGGCVRDLILGKEPNDWDITTNARPEQILSVFSEAKYKNTFGTVILPIRESEGADPIDVLEITTYRSEQGYSDRRHPDEVFFEDSLDRDLERRDFTVNALALAPAKEQPETKHERIINLDGQEYAVVDLFGGLKDLKEKIIRAVGEPVDRFKEDALRMMRAIRFSCQLGFEIEPKTARGILKLAGTIKFVSNERIRDELIKILSSENSEKGIRLLLENKLLQYILPELIEGQGMDQSHHHIYTVFEHSVLSLKYCPSSDWHVRFAALLHDVGKPKSRRFINGQATFYNHEYIGAKMVERIMKRLKFSNEDSFRVVNLVKNHMFYYNVGEVTAASVRRLIAKTGRENLKDLIDIRIADRIGSGVKVAKPYKLRHLEYMLEKVQNDPVSAKMLKIDGNELMDFLGVPPGPKLGAMIDVLLSEVIENPELNDNELLRKRSQELNLLDVEELREQAKEVIENKREADDRFLKRDFKV